MRPFPALAALLLALPASLHAECLTSADLDAGITIDFDNGDRNTVRRIEGDFYAYEEYYAAYGYSGQFEAWHALYPVRGNWQVDGGVPDPSLWFERTYSVDPTALPVPDEGSGVVSLTFDEATGTRPLTNWTVSSLALAWGPTAPLAVEGCTYRAAAIEFLIDWMDGSGGGSTTWFYYLPDLGVGFVQASKPHGGEVFAARPLRIARLGAP